MEPIKQPARNYLFYHNGNEQMNNKIKNNTHTHTKMIKGQKKIIIMQDELQSLVKHF